MAFLYPQIGELFQGASSPISPLFIHLIVLFISACLSLYGLYGVVKYSKTFSKNWHLLAVAFGLIAFMPLGDIFEHLGFWPGEEYWHHLHLFAGVIAFYFMHYFVTKMDSDKQESASNTTITLIVLSALAVLFVFFEETYGDTYSWVLGIIYAVAIVVCMVYLKFLWDIWHKSKKSESAFSLKTFFTSMLPLISITLFILTFTGILAEAGVDLRGEDGAATDPGIVFLIILQNPLFLIMAMALTNFAYIGEKIHSFYAPIEKFVAAKMARGQNQRKERARNPQVNGKQA